MNAVGENYKKMAPEEGFEPPTKWLTATCSTVELFRNTSRGQIWIVLIFVNRIMLLAFPYFFTGALFSFDAGRYVLLSLVFVYTGQ